MRGVRLGESQQDPDVRARGGQARGDRRVPLPPVRQVLFITKVVKESQVY